VRRYRTAIVGVLAGGLIGCSAAQAAAPELSTTNRLQDRRVVAAGQRSYVEGFADGRFYANGWHTTGEMGGVWSAPLKLVDGVWFGIGNTWVGQATRFTSGWGYTRYALPGIDGLSIQRTDFAPDAHRAALFGLTISNPGAARTVPVTVDAHSELMSAYPWGFTGVVPNASDNLPDHGRFDGRSLVFTDDGTLGSGAPVHHYAALVAATLRPDSGTAAASGGNFRGPQPGHACAGNDSTSPPSACDDGPYGRGTGGELTYQVALPANGTRTLWIAVAGSDKGLSDAQSQLAGALRDPAGELAAKIASREALGNNTVVSLPGDSLLQDAVTWGKQNLADETQTASDLQIRWTNQGKQYPSPLGTVAHARWFAAGYPDYPWIFATDGEYTAFAAVTVGQFTTIEDHLRALKDVSEILNGSSGIVAHETVSDGSVYYGHNSQTTANGTTTNDFNTDETVKFPSAVALVWRWTGDNAFRDEMYAFARAGMRTIATHYSTPDGWPTGSGNVERAGMGPVKLDNAVYFIRGLYDLADMARSKHDRRTAAWARHLANRLSSKFEATWWDAPYGQYADSLQEPGNVKIFQKYWIGQTPMEAQLTLGTRTVPGLAIGSNGNTALAGRENSCYSGERPGNRGLYHNGCGGGADGKGDTEIFSLTTSIQAIGEGNYGRLGPDQQQRYTDANAETMFSEPATGGTPDEMPGAMPEIFPSTPPQDIYPTPGIPPNIDRCWTCRSSVMQAWGNYGTMWAVVDQQLGVRPFLPYSLLEVVPQVPPGQPSVAGSHIRLGMGSGAVDVFASHAGSQYTTRMSTSGLSLNTILIGHTLPHGTRPAVVTLDGRTVHSYMVNDTHRGIEVTVRVGGGGLHTLVITAA
jgi:hypothetical protein